MEGRVKSAGLLLSLFLGLHGAGYAESNSGALQDFPINHYDMDATFAPQKKPGLSTNLRRVPPPVTYERVSYDQPVLWQTSGSPVLQREKKEARIAPDSFAITLYKPNYILPLYMTGSPDNTVYSGTTPNDEQLKHNEVKFQLSVKVPVWQNIMHHRTSLYFAYSQLSYWQLYNHNAFIRENDYEPELFLAQQTNYPIGKCWHVDFLNLGAVHQSNGLGTSLERTWNRIYVEAIASTDHWMLSLKPWYIIRNGSLRGDNPDIQKFLGYGRILLAYKRQGQVFSLEAHNLIEGFARSATGQATWSFPLTCYLRGYVQLFSGYGQSLIEYNHRSNSAGIGIAFNDWV